MHKIKEFLDSKEVIFHTMKQQSDEWYEVKSGVLSATDAKTLTVSPTKKTLGAGAMTVLYKKFGEIITGSSLDGFKGNAVTDRGNELEPIAIQRYMDLTFEIVEEVGFVQVGEYLGFSPDGLIGVNGGCEIKCPEATEFSRFLDTGFLKDNDKYIAQMQWSMFLSGRKWWDYVVFHPEFRNKSLNIERVGRDEEMIEIMAFKAQIFIDKIETMLKPFN
jgi:hypothetical protein